MMFENEEKEDYQSVEPKYIDPEGGLTIDLEKENLYKLKKTRKHMKIVKPVSGDIESPFDKLDRSHPEDLILEEFEETTFLTDALLEEIIWETLHD
jgi:hypothetical protein